MIRIMTENDMAPFNALRLRAIVDSPTIFVADLAEETKRSSADICNRVRPTDFQCIFGKFNGTALLGMVGLQRERLLQASHKACVWGLFVDPLHRSMGIARHLLHAVISHAQTQGILQIHLCVGTENMQAKRLYQSLGFVRYGIEPRAAYIEDRFYDDEYVVLHLDRDALP